MARFSLVGGEGSDECWSVIRYRGLTYSRPVEMDIFGRLFNRGLYSMYVCKDQILYSACGIYIPEFSSQPAAAHTKQEIE